MLAQEAAARLGLERVLLVPTGRAPHKRIEDDPGMTTRLRMTSAAAAVDELLEVDPVEIEAASAGDRPSYTSETLATLHRGRGSELFLLMGADAAAGLPDWHEPARVLELARLGIAARPGTAVEAARAALERLGAGARAELIRMPELDISSTEIRRRVAQGRPVRYLVPDAVLEMIEAEGLYR